MWGKRARDGMDGGGCTGGCGWGGGGVLVYELVVCVCVCVRTISVLKRLN